MVGGGGLCLLTVHLTGIAGELYASPVLRVSGTGGRDEAGRSMSKAQGRVRTPLATCYFLPPPVDPTSVGEEGVGYTRVDDREIP